MSTPDVSHRMPGYSPGMPSQTRPSGNYIVRGVVAGVAGTVLMTAF